VEYLFSTSQKSGTGLGTGEAQQSELEAQDAFCWPHEDFGRAHFFVRIAPAVVGAGLESWHLPEQQSELPLHDMLSPRQETHLE
jgi:hypothetical protein